MCRVCKGKVCQCCTSKSGENLMPIRTVLAISAVLGMTVCFGTSVSAQVGSQTDSLKAPSGSPVQCSAKPNTFTKIQNQTRRDRIVRSVATLAAPSGGGTKPSHHCCDANGCSGPVDLLTVCPVIKVECKYTKNSCTCEPI